MLPTKFRFIWESSLRGEDFFRNRPIRNKNWLWRQCLLTDRDEMSNLYRGPSIDASYHVSVHLAKRFQKRWFYLNRPIWNKNCLWQPYLSMDRDNMSNLYRGPSIDASYQVAAHLAKGFQRKRLKCEKLTDDRRRTLSDGKSSSCLWQGEQQMQSIFFIWQYIKQYFLFYILEVFLSLWKKIFHVHCLYYPIRSSPLVFTVNL
jgi:hypothetical protein